jgi:sugar lactone lactonase YvrE
MTAQHTDDTMQLALEQPAILGEGLLWHATSGYWWWTDIKSSILYAWSPTSGALLRCKTPDRVGSFAHCRSGRLLLGLAKQLGFAETPPTQESAGLRQLQVQPAADVDAAEARTRVNDGRTDRRGFFVFGTMNEGKDQRPIGSFYQYSLQYGLRRLALPAVSIANSICFSLDGKTMYFTDTLTRRIMQCDYDAESAQTANVRLFAAVDQAHAYPDGSVIDADGCLWNAQWGAGRIVQYATDGSMLRVLRVPAKNPTCPAFGGTHLDQLVVTSSRQEMSSEELQQMPQAGSLFTFATPVAVGVIDTPFDDRAPT